MRDAQEVRLNLIGCEQGWGSGKDAVKRNPRIFGLEKWTVSGTDTGNPREDNVYVITMYAVKFGYVGLRYRTDIQAVLASLIMCLLFPRDIFLLFTNNISL